MKRTMVFKFTVLLLSIVLIIYAIHEKYFSGYDYRFLKDWNDPTIEASVPVPGNYVADDYDEAVVPLNMQLNNYEYRETLRQIKHNKYYAYQINFTDHIDNCIKLHRIIGYAVCPRRTDWMSYHARIYGLHEVGHSWNTLRLLRKTPSAAFIDVGANVGLMTMPAANILSNENRLIIAVEPFPPNMRHLAYAARINKINLDNFVLIDRAMYNTSNLTFKLVEDYASSNVRIPETLLEPKHPRPFRPSQLTFQAQTATFDSHILPILKAAGISTAIIKIDIEGNECTALASPGTDNFFAEINVPYIMMEWTIYHISAYFTLIGSMNPHGTPQKSCTIAMVNRLKKLSYLPFISSSKGLAQSLPPNDPFNWKSSNVIWKKIL